MLELSYSHLQVLQGIPDKKPACCPLNAESAHFPVDRETKFQWYIIAIFYYGTLPN